MYIRLREQFNINITNNNLVKCSYNGCLKTDRHNMVCKYLKCECNQINCTLKYQYRHCDSVNEWQLFRDGEHPFVPNKVVVKRGVALHVIKLIEEMLAINPDMKPKEVLHTLSSRRKANEILEKEIKLIQSIKQDYTPPTMPKQDYLFDKVLMPDLTKV